MPTTFRRLLLVALALGLAAARARADVTVALTPAIQTVTPGTDFDVFIDVTQAGAAWNGWEMTVAFDPSAVTLLPASPTSSQQGCYMTGGCSSACGNTFHVFNAAADSAAISDVLLCNQVTLPGPGRIYHLRFHAANTQQGTQISIRRVNFYNAGVFVTPVHATGCQVFLSVGVGGPAGNGVSPLHVLPNPSFGPVSFLSSDDLASATEIRIVDLQGRTVANLGPETLGARGRLEWDGRDARGTPVAPGLYLAHVRHGSLAHTLRIVRIP